MKGQRVIATPRGSLWQAGLAGILALAVVACTQAAPAGPGSSGGTAPAGAAGATTAGGRSSAGSGSMPKDACALLTTGELQSATGKSFGAGKTVPVTGGVSCEWDTPGGLVSVDIVSLDHDQFVFERDHLQGTPVPGVGDEAWAGGPGPAVFVARGTLEITVQVVGLTTNDATIAAETALAKLVVSRL